MKREMVYVLTKVCGIVFVYLGVIKLGLILRPVIDELPSCFVVMQLSLMHSGTKSVQAVEETLAVESVLTPFEKSQFVTYAGPKTSKITGFYMSNKALGVL